MMNVDAIFKSAMEELRSMVKSDMILGEPIRMGENVMVIPVCKIRFGFGSGSGNPTAEAGGAGFAGAGSVDPVGFLTIVDSTVQLLSFKSPTGTVDRVIDSVPGLVEKLATLKRKMDQGDKPAEPAAPAADKA